MDLFWNKCQGDVWCRLSTVNLAHEHFNNMFGVYIVWHGGPQPATVKVGYGAIRSELERQRLDTKVQAFANLSLFVTWAATPENQAVLVHAFLVQRLRPIIADVSQKAQPEVSNLPW